jgi:2,5-dioxopentanoate dehydrogenase
VGNKENAVDSKRRSLVGFEFGAEGGEPFSAINPATGGALAPTYLSALPADVDRAAQLAAQAFSSYSRKTGKQKAAFLREVARGIDSIVDQLVIRTPQETALPEPRIRSEAGRTSMQLRLFADLVEDGSWVSARIDRGDPNRKPQPKPDIRSLWRPIGPVAVFCASNFPLAFSVAGGDTASAFAAGNPVIVRAHAAHPGTAELVGEVIRRAVRTCELPEGMFSLLFDAGTQIGAALVRHPKIKAVGFTGSLRGGRALMDLAAARPDPIPVFAEMGSTNPVFILPGALKERGAEIAKGLHGSVTIAAGQMCTKPGLIFVPAGPDALALAENLGDRISQTPAAALLTPQIRSTYESQIKTRNQQKDAALAAHGESPSAGGGTQVSAALFETKASDYRTRPQLAAEVFGPTTLLVSCSNREDLLAIARDLHGHLTATIHGTEEDLREYADLVEIIENKVGRIIFNGYPTGLEVCHAVVHGGPYPATSDGRSTSVGTQAIYRFSRPICYQAFPNASLPAELQDANPLGIWRLVDGNFTRGAVGAAQAAG